MTAAAVVAGVLLTAPPSQATGETATSTTTTAVLPSTTTTLAGLSVAGSGTELASVVASQGTLTLPSTTGLTMSYGYTSSGQSLSFTGTVANINAALAQLTYNAGSSLGTATVTVTVAPNTTGLSFNPANNHFYQYVAGTITWSAARSAASGSTYPGTSLTGYLASATSSPENDYITSKAGANDIWIGGMATDSAGTRTWGWVDDPANPPAINSCSSSAGTVCPAIGGRFTNWNSGEPNNSGGAETAMETNVGGANGLWNDLPASSTAPGYVVEYGTAASDGGTAGVRASATSSVLVANTPGPITGVNIGAVVNGGSVAFTAPSTGAPVTGYQYSLDGGITWNTLQIVNTSGTQRTGLIQGLTSGVSYGVLFRAQSSVGVSSTAGPVALTPTAAPGSGGGGGTTPPTATPTPSAAPTPTPSATPTMPPPSSPPPVLTTPVTPPVVTPAPTSVTISFPAPAAAAQVTGYQYRIGNGAWQTLDVVGTSNTAVTAQIGGLAQGVDYSISVRAVNAAGAGTATTVEASTSVDTSWYRDPLGAGARAGLVTVPVDPKRYDGKLAYTKARYKSYAGHTVVPVSAMNSRPILRKQGAVVLGSKLFRTSRGKLVLTAKGRAQARALAASLRLDAGIRCEGYTDYTGKSSTQKAVSNSRAGAVCAALDSYTTGTAVRAVGYGVKRPVIVGGTHVRRGANYRVVVLVTRNKG